MSNWVRISDRTWAIQTDFFLLDVFLTSFLGSVMIVPELHLITMIKLREAIPPFSHESSWGGA
jgi:hypothetical protein